MFVFKKLIFFIFLFLINSCSLNSFEEIQKNNYSIEIKTSNDRYNLYFKEDLKRFFRNRENTVKEYILNASISFTSTNTLSVSGTNVLKSTKGYITYNLKNKHSNEIIKSGSFTTFPALSSSTNSLYSQQKSIEHIKERLTKSSAKSLYMKLKTLIRSVH
tara:strand:- start:523 stop:1002 length:480 start_codon:yes stop_codon:yes gene_type:complete